MASPAELTLSPVDERKLRRLILFVVAALTAVFLCIVILYVHHGRALLDQVEAIEPTTVLMRGIQLEQQGHTEEAIACYQRSLALGLSWPGSVSNCNARLERLLAARNRDDGLKKDPALVGDTSTPEKP